MTKTIRAALALTVTAIVATACGEAPEQTDAAAPEAPEGIAVTNARMMLPAVSGNPGAVYFDVESFPELPFRDTGVEGDGEDYTLTGDLTIRGITKPVELEVEFTGVAVDPFGATRAGFSAETEISRKEFGLTWNAALETGGFLVSDKVKINLEAALVKQDQGHQEPGQQDATETAAP